jgi:SAM-dependent methyltransferase
MVPETPTAGWRDPDQVGWYLGRVDKLAPRVAGEDALRSTLPARPYAMLDLGCGDGRVTAALALDALRTLATALAVDISAPTLEQARGASRMSRGSPLPRLRGGGPYSGDV